MPRSAEDSTSCAICWQSRWPSPQAEVPIPTSQPERRILVVDDNADAADSLAMLFEARGDRVRVAYDGVEALAAEEAFRPDTILLDIGMPRLSGYEVARRVRELRGDAVLIVAITGWGQEQDRLRAKQAGFDHHFTKPVEIASLMEIIDRRNA